MPSDELFLPMLTTPDMTAVTSDQAWVRAMVEVEIALAQVEEEEGLIPGGVAEALAGVADRIDVGNEERPQLALEPTEQRFS